MTQEILVDRKRLKLKRKNKKYMKLFCKHESLLEHIEDFHGDEINRWPRGIRSMWRCPDCGKYLLKNYLSSSVIVKKYMNDY